MEQQKNTDHTKNSRISRRAVLAAATAIPVLTGNVLCAAPIDPLVALCAEHQRQEAAWEREAEKPGAGDFDTPECLRLWHIREEIERLISDTVATTPDGLAAQLEFVIQERWAPDENKFAVKLFDTMVAGAKQLT